MQTREGDVLNSFKKNPDGTWTAVKPTSLKVGNRVMAISEGMTFTRGEPFMFVDVAEWLEEQSQGK